VRLWLLVVGILLDIYLAYDTIFVLVIAKVGIAF